LELSPVVKLLKRKGSRFLTCSLLGCHVTESLISDCSFDLTGLDTASANINPAGGSIQQDFNLLHIRVPLSFCFNVGVTDLKTGNFTFLANHTNLSHNTTLPL
jgi:hypothetical protein